MKRRIGGWTLAALLILGMASRQALAADEMPSITDHAALASMYSGDAKVLREKAASHQLMLERYEKPAFFPSKGIAFPKAALVQHCRKLVASYTESAKDADQMAKMERELAQASAGKM